MTLFGGLATLCLLTAAPVQATRGRHAHTPVARPGVLGLRRTEPVPGAGPDAATVEDILIDLAWPIACSETASTSTGSTCDMRTSLNSFIPGAAKEKRGIWEMSEVRVYDGGADGDSGTAADNTVFLRPGIFIP